MSLESGSNRLRLFFCCSFKSFSLIENTNIDLYKTHTHEVCPLERGVLPKASITIAIPSKEGWQAKPDGVCSGFKYEKNYQKKTLQLL